MAAAEPSGTYYMAAARSGVQLANMAFGGDTAATTAAYNEAYQAEATRHASSAALATAQKNIASVKQNTILSHTELQKKQDQAEAMAKVSAAAAGVEGTNIDNVIYSTKANEALAVGRASAIEEQQIEKYAADAHSAATQLYSVQDKKIDYFGNLIQSQAGAINAVDLQNLGTWYDETDFFADDEPGYTTATQTTTRGYGQDDLIGA